MIVCHCESVSDRAIAACAAAGHGSVEQIAAVCGAGSDCGSCRGTIEDIIVETVTAVALRPAAA